MRRTAKLAADCGSDLWQVVQFCGDGTQRMGAVCLVARLAVFGEESQNLPLHIYPIDDYSTHKSDDPVHSCTRLGCPVCMESVFGTRGSTKQWPRIVNLVTKKSCFCLVGSSPHPMCILPKYISTFSSTFHLTILTAVY